MKEAGRGYIWERKVLEGVRKMRLLPKKKEGYGMGSQKNDTTRLKNTSNIHLHFTSVSRPYLIEKYQLDCENGYDHLHIELRYLQISYAFFHPWCSSTFTQ